MITMQHRQLGRAQDVFLVYVPHILHMPNELNPGSFLIIIARWKRDGMKPAAADDVASIKRFICHLMSLLSKLKEGCGFPMSTSRAVNHGYSFFLSSLYCTELSPSSLKQQRITERKQWRTCGTPLKSARINLKKLCILKFYGAELLINPCAVFLIFFFSQGFLG